MSPAEEYEDRYDEEVYTEGRDYIRLTAEPGDGIISVSLCTPPHGISLTDLTVDKAEDLRWHLKQAIRTARP